MNGGSGKLDGQRLAVRRRTHSERDLAHRESFTARPRQPAQSVERLHLDDWQEGTRGRRAASGSPRGRRRSCHDPSRGSSTRNVNVDHLSTSRPAASSEHLRRVALVVRQLTDSGKTASQCHHNYSPIHTATRSNYCRVTRVESRRRRRCVLLAWLGSGVARICWQWVRSVIVISSHTRTPRQG